MTRCNASLITGADDTPIVLLVQLPELHILLGPVNSVYNAFYKVWHGSDQWPASY